MINKWISLLFLCPSIYICAHTPVVIDFSQLSPEQIIQYDGADWEGIENICRPFDNALELLPYFDDLQQTFQIDQAIMTGSWDKESAKYFSFLFDKVTAIECDLGLFELAMQEKCFNTNIMFGVSPDMLRQQLPSLQKKRIFFYLDTLHNSPRPLQEELNIIRETHYDNCIIVINHCMHPEISETFNNSIHDQNYSYSSVKSALAKIFSSYDCYYILPKTTGASAKLVVIPTKWQDISKYTAS